MRVAIAVVAVSLCRCSCGGGAAVDAGIGLDDFPTEAAKTVCAKVYGCCTSSEAMGSNFGPDKAGCETNVRQNTFPPVAIKSAQTAGRVAYHGDKASDCLTAYAALSCDQLKSNSTSSIAACDAMLEAKVAVGGACTTDRDCINSTCDGEGIGVDGVCRSFVTESSSCADGGVCSSGLYCQPGTATCVRTRADGTTCNANFECTTGGCNGKDAGVAGTCGLKGGSGTMCYATTGCSASGGSMAIALALLGVAAAARRRRNNA